MATNKDRLTANNALIDQAQELADSLPDAIGVDDTLTVSGAAADAKATGDKFNQLSEAIADKVSKTGITLGLHSDGKYYIFVDGVPVGSGFELSGNSGDVFGYVDENNNIVLNGNLADGSYNIKYEMEDGSTVDIGNLVLDSNVYYSVTNNLTNCTNSNSDTQAIGGQAYTATITANDGYELSYVVVTMGGTDVTADVYSDGAISIASVTGNIVITAVAEEAVQEVTNWIKNSQNEDGTVFNNGTGYKTGIRLSLSSGGETTSGATNYECTGYIPVKPLDVVRIKDVDLTDENSTNFVCYDINHNPINGGSANYGNKLYTMFVTHGTESNGVYTTTLVSSIHNALQDADLAYIRIGSKSITEDSILTINQEIV